MRLKTALGWWPTEVGGNLHADESSSLRGVTACRSAAVAGVCISGDAQQRPVAILNIRPRLSGASPSAGLRYGYLLHLRR